MFILFTFAYLIFIHKYMFDVSVSDIAIKIVILC